MDEKPKPQPSRLGKLYYVSDSHQAKRIGNAYAYRMSSIPAGALAKYREKPKPKAQPAARLLTVPVQLTLCQGSTRTWDEIDGLVELANQVFGRARVALEIAESHQCQQVPVIPDSCPFRDDLDHSYEWLHLAFVATLPEGRPQLAPCNRCLLLADASPDREVLQQIGLLLGLWPVRDPADQEGLMAGGTGLAIRPNEQVWLRWHAARLREEAWGLQTIKVPLWIYLVESPGTYQTKRSQTGIREILQKAQYVWNQANVVFELSSFCHLQQEEIDEAGWARFHKHNVSELHPLVKPIIAHAPKALHLFFVGGASNAHTYNIDCSIRLAVIADTLTENRSRTLAWVLGRLLWMAYTTGDDQLMTKEGSGYRIGAQELMRVRNSAHSLIS